MLGLLLLFYPSSELLQYEEQCLLRHHLLQIPELQSSLQFLLCHFDLFELKLQMIKLYPEKLIVKQL